MSSMLQRLAAVASLAVDAGFWKNAIHGIGDIMDPRRSWLYDGGDCLDRQTLEELYDHNRTAQIIVNARVDDGLRQGFEIPGEHDDLEEAAKRHKALRIVRKGARWGRAYGGAALILDIEGQDPCMPLAGPEFIPPGALKRVLVRSRFDLEPVYPYDVEDGADLYRLQPMEGTASAEDWQRGEVMIHRSRMWIFEGSETSLLKRRHLSGWWLSVLDVVWEGMQSHAANYDGADRVMTDLSQAVFKLNGVIEALSGDNAQGAADFLTRIRNMDRARGIANAIVLDADSEETFEQIGRANVTGIPAMLDKSDQRLAMLAGMPVTRLMGISPAGLNATGEADIRRWYDEVIEERGHTTEPALVWLLRAIAAHEGIAIAEDEKLVEWPSLWQRTPQEEDEQRRGTLAMWGTAAQQGVVTDEESAAAIERTGLFPEFERDEAARAEKKAMAEQLRAQLTGGGSGEDEGAEGGSPGDDGGGGDASGPPSPSDPPDPDEEDEDE